MARLSPMQSFQVSSSAAQMRHEQPSQTHTSPSAANPLFRAEVSKVRKFPVAAASQRKHRNAKIAKFFTR